MKSGRMAAYWYATAIVLVASALMRGISTPHVFPWWFLGAEFGGGIVFGVLAWWLGRGSSLARLLLLVAGTLVVLGAVALLVTGRGYEFGAVPAALGVIVTATGGELRRRSQQVSVPAVGDWTPMPVVQAAGPSQPLGPWPGQGGPSPQLPPQHDTRPSWQQASPTRPPAGPPPQHPTLPPQHPTAPPQHPTLPPQHPTLPPPQHPTGPTQHPTLPPQHPTRPPQYGTLPPQHGTYPPAAPPQQQGLPQQVPSPQQSPPPRGAPGDPPWRRVPGPSVPALPGEPPALPHSAPPPAEDGTVPPARARHAAGPAPDAEPRPASDPEVQWAPRRRRHARPEPPEGSAGPSPQEPEEN